MKKLKVLSLFSGIGAFEKALTNLNAEYEVVNYCEIDKFASIAYSAIHNVSNTLNLQDITQIDPNQLKDFDLLTHGSPCQDYSVAGKGNGGDEGTGTRSSLMWNTVEIIKVNKPKYVIWENVKNVLSKKHKHNFDKYINTLNKLGYNNYYKVLNAKNYGVPQNRERIFVISIRKDIDKSFEFPEGFDNGIRLKDILENEIDKKYYVKFDKVKKLISELNGRLRVKEAVKNGYTIAKYGDSINTQFPNSKTRRGRVGKQIAQTLDTSCNQAVIEKVGNINPSGKGISGEIFNEEGLSPTLTANDSKEPKKIVKIRACLTPDRINKRQNGRRFKEDNEPMFTLTGQDKHGILQIGDIANPKALKMHNRVFSEEGISPCLTTGGGDKAPKLVQCKIRKLTPLECWRLMGFTDKDYLKARKTLEETFYNGKDKSNSQMYKMAGNSICVPVLENIFIKLFK